MSGRLRIRLFAHSWVSDWNHGNAHFLRGLARALLALGHEVRCYEEIGAWSLANLAHEERSTASIEGFRARYPGLDVRFYQRNQGLGSFLNHELAGADLVLVHEWNEPALVQEIVARKARLGFRVLFHDTHHRAYTSPAQILQMPLDQFDGVLAFGEAIRRIYADGFGISRVWTFHEAADTEAFHPLERSKENDVIWIGNWGDEERTRELMEFLVAPIAALQAECSMQVHGVRYPEHAQETLRQAGIRYCGYLPNLDAPEAYARSRVSLHIPRRQYANGLSGVPTIRVFEVLACGIPLVCSPWSDTESLFRPGEDYLIAANGSEMQSLLRWLLCDESARLQIAASGLESIRRHHTCSHRAAQLMEIYGEIRK